MEKCYLVETPMAAEVTKFIIPFDGQATVKNIELYGLKIGFLMYLVIQTKLNIAYKVFILLQFLLNFFSQHMKVVN